MKTTFIRYGIIISILVMLIMVCYFIMFKISIVSLWGTKKSDNGIIKVFQNNIVIFENSLNELLQENENSIYFEKDSGTVDVKIHFNDGNDSKILHLDDKGKIKYQNTINLMKNLKLEKVLSENGNVSYMFNSMMGLAQYIVYLNNQDKYQERYHVVDSKIVQDKWYYIETK